MDDLEALRRISSPDRISYLPPGIITQDFQRDAVAGKLVRRKEGIAEDVPLLFTAARFRSDVKFDSMIYLFKSLSILRRTRPDFILLVAGDGPMDAELRRAADRYIPGMVHFAGRVRRQAMPSYYSAADLFVFPGIGESLGMVYLEAQSCGLPVVALATGGVPQVVRHGETGLLVPQDKGHSMAMAVDQLLEDDTVRRELGAKASQFVRKERDIYVHSRQLSELLELIRSST
jgi:glycosyltransferase involved in cell wall biosynthesis